MANKGKLVEKQYLIPFIIVTSLFALWGFANDITNPMVAAFKTIMEISNAKAALIQFAFYGGYATMAIPAALFVRKYSYKKAIILGLSLYAIGALLFYPAAHFEEFGFFLASLYILTFGLAFLETTANPYIMSMGDEQTSTRRLNLAQSFNPMGSILGMFVASNMILTSLQSDQRDVDGHLIFDSLSAVEKVAVRTHDLVVIRNPYVILGLVVIMMIIIFLATKMPHSEDSNNNGSALDSMKRLLKNRSYCQGVVAQVFYVGVQIMCWTFIIQYAGRLGVPKSTAQQYNIIAMAMFILFRFVSTYLMKYINSRKLLLIFGIGGVITILGTIFLQNINGLYCLMATSIFMSLMFPTIYGIALEDVGADMTLGAAGLVMAIVGGALMPPLQGAIMDKGIIMGMPAENVSFVLPLICFIVIVWYGYKSINRYGV